MEDAARRSGARYERVKRLAHFFSRLGFLLLLPRHRGRRRGRDRERGNATIIVVVAPFVVDVCVLRIRRLEAYTAMNPPGFAEPPGFNDRAASRPRRFLTNSVKTPRTSTRLNFTTRCKRGWTTAKRARICSGVERERKRKREREREKEREKEKRQMKMYTRDY